MSHNSLFQTSKNASATVEELKTSPAGQSKKSKPWRPVTLRAPYLVSLILVTAGLIFVIQWLLATSQREQGIIFAADINDLPLRRSFCYLYLPTIISVIYSFLWTWVDLDVKRLEPYFQLSRARGVTGSNSLLLDYPLEFLVTIPLTAFKKKHWTVLTASTIPILVFWGLTPIQAGIFATRTVNLETSLSGRHATTYTPLDRQGNVTAIYAQSVYNIAWLNESLPPFMTKEYVLSPFGPVHNAKFEANQANYTGNTTMFTVDIGCQAATLWDDPDAGIVRYNGSLVSNDSEVCSFYAPPYRTNGGNDTSRPFDTMYVGYQNQNGMADYYLSTYCNKAFFHYFFVRWSKSTDAFIRANGMNDAVNASQAQAAALFCKPTYYQQDVSATISLPSQSVLGIEARGIKSEFPVDMFNISTFEWAMSSGQEQVPDRGDFPSTGFPSQQQQLADMPLNLAYLPPMAPFAIATYPKELGDYLDPETLRLSYQSAYRLLFARQAVDILGHDLKSAATIARQTWTTQAVVVVPGFAIAATALLAVIFVLGSCLLVVYSWRANQMEHDPATIGALMTMMFNGSDTLETFGHLDRASSKALRERLQHRTFSLHDSRLHELENSDHREWPLTNHQEPAQLTSKSTKTSGIRPTEMRLGTGCSFLVLQITALIAISVLYTKALRNGLSLPSQSTFVRQLLENYVPIALATLIEPFWLVLNRLLSLLQPFEELRKGNAASTRSTDLDYSSLPPQLLFFRAFGARHYALTSICFMVLLANVLSVALSGLMFEGTADIATRANFTLPNLIQFKDLNGTGLPFNTDKPEDSQGGTTSDQFYREMSNLTAGTPLPPWSDERYAYLPVETTSKNTSAKLNVLTIGIGAELQCQLLGPQNYTLKFTDTAREADFKVHLAQEDGSTVTCTNFEKWSDDNFKNLGDPQPGHVGLEVGAMLTNNKTRSVDLFCRQNLVYGWLRIDWKTISGNVTYGPGLTYYDKRHMNITSRNDTMILCKAKLSISQANITVDYQGRVQERLSVNASSSSLHQYFTSTPEDFIAQANQFLIDMAPTWHTDSNASDFTNYLIKKSTNDSSLLDPRLPVPDPDHAAKLVSSMYTKLFAIFVATNTDLLFPPSTGPTIVSGYIIRPETRIRVSTPAYIVTVVIFACYILTTSFFYAKRPWRILPRLPSTPASNMAFFAASRAFEGVQRGETGREQWTWAYGKFVGVDGKTHVGIEREPFVKLLKKDE